MFRLLLILLVIALYLFVFLISWGWTYGYLTKLLLRRKISRKEWKTLYNDYCLYVLWGIDQAANPAVKYNFTHWFIRPGGKPFGNVDETLSHVLGVNKYFVELHENDAVVKARTTIENKLYPVGMMLARLVDLIFWFVGDKDKNGNPNHLKKAATADQFNKR